MALVIDGKDKGYFCSYILRRISRNQNFLCAITGSTGSGKSWSALRLAETLDPNFSADNICFTARQFLDLVNGKAKQLKKGSVILFDEMQVSLGHLDFQTLQAKLLNYVLQTFRHRNFILLITTPHFNFINATSRKLFHSRMETLSIDKNKQQVKLKPYLLQVSQDEGKIYRKYLRVYSEAMGIVPLKVINVAKPSPELIDAYEHKKNEFTTQLNESIASDLARLEEGRGQKELTSIQEEIVKDLIAGLSVSEIATKRGNPEQVIYFHINQAKKKGIKVRPKKDGNRVIGYEVKGYNDC